MTDTITLLTSCTGNRTTKMWLADGSVSGYAAGMYFNVSAVPVVSLPALSHVLTTIQSNHNVMAIRGAYPAPDFGVLRRKILVEDISHHWMMVDIDKYVPPEGTDPVLDPVTAIYRYIEDHLPECFDGAGFHWQLSSSAGHPENREILKAHVWFWLTEPLTSTELTAWADTRSRAVDRSIYRVIQPHYTALPLFAPGVSDPVPVRSGFVAGCDVSLVLTPAMLANVRPESDDDKHDLLDPRTKTGLIGAFCRAFTIEQTLDRFLPGKFEFEPRSDRRLTWKDGGGSPGGAFITGDRLHLVSTHNTSPSGLSALNAFDLLRTHAYGSHDVGADLLSLAEMGSTPSYRATCDALKQVPEVLTELQMGPPGELPPATENPASADPDPVTGLASPYPPPFRGVMQEVVESALAGSIKPQLDLCTLSALIGMAASCSGNYRLPSGMRLNLFGCGVAGTGEGKDRPRSIAMSLVVAAKGKLIGKPASGPGLEDSLVSTTGSLIALDEIAHFFAAINNSKAPPHLIELAGTLLQLFSVSNGTYHQRVLAAASRTSPLQPIQNPVVSLLGFATPEKLGEAMGVSNIEDGLLGRFLFAFGQTGIAPRRIADSRDLPEPVRRAADKLNQSDKQASFTADLQGHRDPIQIDPAAETRLGELLVEFDQQRQTSESAFAKALLTRSCEKCERVAGVLAVWDCPAKPVITLEHVTWAAHLLHASDSALLRFSGEYMHGGQTQADGQRILKLVQRTLAGEFKTQKPHEKWLLDQNVAPYSMVMRASKLDKRRFDDAVAHLVDLFDLQSGSVQSTHPNGRAETVRWLSLRA